MEELMYKVLPGKKITGRHRVYVAGQVYPQREAVGDMEKAVKQGIVEVVKKEPLPAPAPKRERGRPKKDGGGENGAK